MAAYAIADWQAFSNYEPTRNYVDYMKALPFTSGGFVAASGVDGKLSWSTTVTRSGKKSLSFEPSTSNDSIKAYGPPFRVREGSSYMCKMTGNQPVTGGLCAFYFDWLDADYNSINSVGAFWNTATTGWRTKAFRAVAPANTKFAAVYIEYSNATIKLYVDEITVEDEETGRTPIGGIVPFHKDINSGTLQNVPSGYVSCDGQTLSDVFSPLDGQLIPNLNNNAGAAQSGYFIRGTNSTTGNTQTDIMASHTHGATGLTVSPNPHSHTVPGVTGTPATVIAVAGLNAETITTNRTAGTSLSIIGATAAQVPNSTETRPINYGMRYIMRVR